MELHVGCYMGREVYNGTTCRVLHGYGLHGECYMCMDYMENVTWVWTTWRMLHWYGLRAHVTGVERFTMELHV